MKVIDRTAPRRALRVRIDPSPAYDFVACLYLLGHRESSLDFDVPRRWVERARAALGAGLRGDLALLLPWRGRTLGLVGVLDGHTGATVEGFIGRVTAAPPEVLVELMLAESLADRRGLPRLRAALGRTGEPVEAYLAATDPDLDRTALRRLVELPPAEVKARLVRLLREAAGPSATPRPRSSNTPPAGSSWEPRRRCGTWCWRRPTSSGHTT
jgi:hypothetical protein